MDVEEALCEHGLERVRLAQLGVLRPLAYFLVGCTGLTMRSRDTGTQSLQGILAPLSCTENLFLSCARYAWCFFKTRWGAASGILRCVRHGFRISHRTCGRVSERGLPRAREIRRVGVEHVS